MGALNALEGGLNNRIERWQFSLWQQLENCWNGGRALNFGCYDSLRLKHRLTSTAFLLFSNALAEFLAPFGQGITSDTGKFDECRLSLGG